MAVDENVQKVLHVMEIVNLTDFFTKLFAIPSFIDEVFNYIENLSSDDTWIDNFIQSKFWKETKSKVYLNDDEIDHFSCTATISSH